MSASERAAASQRSACQTQNFAPLLATLASMQRLSVLLVRPRGFCAGVERAVRTVEGALAQFGAPVFVRHEIVHNAYVVGQLVSKGAIFVGELDAVPDGGRFARRVPAVLLRHPGFHRRSAMRAAHWPDAHPYARRARMGPRSAKASWSVPSTYGMSTCRVIRATVPPSPGPRRCGDACCAR